VAAPAALLVVFPAAVPVGAPATYVYSCKRNLLEFAMVFDFLHFSLYKCNPSGVELAHFNGKFYVKCIIPSNSVS
jgi:hypothetical protein